MKSYVDEIMQKMAENLENGDQEELKEVDTAGGFTDYQTDPWFEEVRNHLGLGKDGWFHGKLEKDGRPHLYMIKRLPYTMGTIQAGYLGEKIYILAIVPKNLGVTVSGAMINDKASNQTRDIFMKEARHEDSKMLVMDFVPVVKAALEKQDEYFEEGMSEVIN